MPEGCGSAKGQGDNQRLLTGTGSGNMPTGGWDNLTGAGFGTPTADGNLNNSGYGNGLIMEWLYCNGNGCGNIYGYCEGNDRNTGFGDGESNGSGNEDFTGPS